MFNISHYFRLIKTFSVQIHEQRWSVPLSLLSHTHRLSPKLIYQLLQGSLKTKPKVCFFFILGCDGMMTTFSHRYSLIARFLVWIQYQIMRWFLWIQIKTDCGAFLGGDSERGGEPHPYSSLIVCFSWALERLIMHQMNASEWQHNKLSYTACFAWFLKVSCLLAEYICSSIVYSAGTYASLSQKPS